MSMSQPLGSNEPQRPPGPHRRGARRGAGPAGGGHAAAAGAQETAHQETPKQHGLSENIGKNK